MVAHISTFAYSGIDTITVEVQVHIASGMPSFTIVGLPDKAVAESRERVRVAIQALGLALPAKRITINLAPADIAKEGSHFDLPIAIGVLVAMQIIPQDAVNDYMAMGELSLDGRILPVSGVLPAAIGCVAEEKGLICPAGNAQEAAWAGDLDVLAPDSLYALINHIKGEQVLSPPIITTQENSTQHPDLSQIRGHQHAKRALEIAAAGGHNMLMVGPPGTGKSMLAACLPGILPALTNREMLDISMIASVAGHLPDTGLMNERPFRAPHHSASLPAMVGGGKRAKPGEISLAHRGVLFLDELPEFPRAVIEALRQPLETRQVSISRANAHITYPASFQLIAAMNPCRCGYLSDPERTCSKAPRCGEEYQHKISGPMLDRFDIHIDVPMLSAQDMFDTSKTETSDIVASRVKQAYQRQHARYDNDYTNNATATPLQIDALAWTDDAKKLLQDAALKLKLSMRGITRLSRVAATISDLDGHALINRHAIAEALNYRHMNHDQHRITA